MLTGTAGTPRRHANRSTLVPMPCGRAAVWREAWGVDWTADCAADTCVAED